MLASLRRPHQQEKSPNVLAVRHSSHAVRHGPHAMPLWEALDRSKASHQPHQQQNSCHVGFGVATTCCKARGCHGKAFGAALQVGPPVEHFAFLDVLRFCAVVTLYMFGLSTGQHRSLRLVMTYCTVCGHVMAVVIMVLRGMMITRSYSKALLYCLLCCLPACTYDLTAVELPICTASACGHQERHRSLATS